MGDGQHSGFANYPLEKVALGLLMPGPKHGYGLYRDFARHFGSIWKAGQAKFYLALSELEQQGYLRSTTELQESRPPRKVYHLTELGRAIFLDWLHAPVDSMRAMRVEFIARLRFFSLLSLPGAGRLIDAQIELFRAMLAEWEAETEHADPFHALIHDFRRRQAIFIIEWLLACKEKHVREDVFAG